MLCAYAFVSELLSCIFFIIKIKKLFLFFFRYACVYISRKKSVEKQIFRVMKILYAYLMVEKRECAMSSRVCLSHILKSKRLAT